MDQPETRWVRCDCTTHAVSLTKWDYEGAGSTIDLGVWHAYRGGDGWRHRLRLARGALQGKLYGDDVILTEETARELIVNLHDLLGDA